MSTKTAKQGSLRDVIAAAGFSITAFANALGVSRQTVYYWVGGVTMPRAKHIRQMSTVLKVPMQQLLRTLYQ